MKCVYKNCPNKRYKAEPIYHSKYCEDHLDFDENLKPIDPKEAYEYFKKHDPDSKIKKLLKEIDWRYVIDDVDWMQQQVRHSHRRKQLNKLSDLKKLVDGKND